MQPAAAWLLALGFVLASGRAWAYVVAVPNTLYYICASVNAINKVDSVESSFVVDFYLNAYFYDARLANYTEVCVVVRYASGTIAVTIDSLRGAKPLRSPHIIFFALCAG